MSRDSALSKHVIEFLVVAKEFVAFAETRGNYDKNTYLDISSKLLSMLYLKALFLPEAAESNQDENYEFEFVTVEKYESVKSNFEQLLGESDVFVPLKDAAMINSVDYINISLSELMADIYQDVANFVEAFRIGEDVLMEEARIKCTLNFKFYWGIRLLTFLENLHRIRYIETNNE